MDSDSKLVCSNESVDLLILGAGWTSSFLIPYLISHHKDWRYQSTTRSGGGPYNSIRFEFDPTKPDDLSQFATLPNAKTILISFPIKDSGASELLLKNYSLSRASTFSSKDTIINVIQLGSSGIFDGGPTLSANPQEGLGNFKAKAIWIDRHSDYNIKNPRAQSEDELLKLNKTLIGPTQLIFQTTVLNLSGLWGGQRHIRNFVSKVIAPTKQVLRSKNSIHMIHGLDVSRAIVAVIKRFSSAAGQRWIVTDQRVYDWWDLASAWGETGTEHRDSQTTIGPQAQWVNELMTESNLKALPRPPEVLGRALDSQEFWTTFGLTPVRARLEHSE
ncbi:hypothetical protein O181_002023 [Austropuccinia psidii MF-1]|uniref:Uncharacterized protein n=1 Tax=Austropuccinia psidii MF-1 TaxID=1389203 RepID=A0A9Q3GC86_9BASI|nr:hypothetical protein [Austropuccinia psidii MF-1]